MKKLNKIIMLSVIVSVALGATFLTVGIVKNIGVAQSFKYVDYDIVDVFHDQGYLYVNPLEPTRDEDITIRIRTIRGNITGAEVKYTFDIASNDRTYYSAKMVYEKPDESGYYDYWVGIIPKQNNPFRYHFKLENNKEFIYYNATGYSLPNQELRNNNGDFLIKPGFSTPLWSQGATWYSIMPDSFFNGDILNDKYFQSGVVQNPWGNSHFHTNDYFGGDLLGVELQTDYIKNLGATAIQFNPFWISTHQAGYGTFDLSQVDSAFGNNEMLKRLTDHLHEKELKIVLDGVFKYFNENGVWYNSYGSYPLPGAVSPRDPYHDIYMRDSNGQIIRSWGSPEIDFSSRHARELIYSTPESIIQTYLNEFNIDGFRLDVGESLRGSDPNNWGTAEQILKDMRPYFKAIGEDKLFMSEHGGGPLVFDYTLDTKWNYDFGWPVRDWAKGISNNLVLAARLYDGINRLPRSVANSSYNFLSNHDEARIFNYINGDVVKMNAAHLLQMTYIGAPSIYFGDEIGMYSLTNPGVGEKAPTSFDSFNWDQSTWDYDVYYYFMALSQLRQDYEKVYRDGVFKSLIVNEDIFAYGRWNEGGKAITIINQSEDVIKDVEIEARQLSVKDGAVLTDYLTGKTYKVKNGYVTIDVMPGGAVLVDGGKASHYRGGYELANENSKTTVTREALNTYQLSGKGSLDGTFLHTPGFNNVEIEAKVGNTSGEGALMIRQNVANNAPFYAAVTDQNGKVTIQYRETMSGQIKTLTSFTLGENQKVKIARTSNNIFRAYIGDTGNWTEVPAAKTTIYMDYDVKVGLAPIKGNFTFTDVKHQQLTKQLFEDFESTLGSMFSVKQANYQIENGWLTLTTDQTLGQMLTQAPYQDFTLQTRLDYQPDQETQFAGLTVLQDSNHGIVAGVKLIDDVKQVFIGMLVSGDLVIFDHAPYEGQTIDLQLEKMGANYRLRYRGTNESWSALDGTINANYSKLLAGALVSGPKALKLDYISFGNALVDGTSLAAHAYTGDLPINTDLNLVLQYTQSYYANSGTWSYVTGGFRQEDKSLALSQLYFNNAQFNGFKAEFTLKINEMEEAGTIGYRFGLPTQNTPFDQKYMMVIDQTGLLELMKDGNVIGTHQIPHFGMNQSYRFVISSDQGVLNIYMNEAPMAILSVGETVPMGYMQIFGTYTDYEVISPNVFHQTPNWYAPMGNVVVTDDNVVLHPRSLENPYHYSYLAKEGVTDVLFAANVKMERLNINRAQFGVILGATVGKHPLHTGVYVGINDLGELVIKQNDEILAYQLIDDINTESFYFLVAVSEQTVSVYINNETKPSLTYQHQGNLAGAIGFYTDSSRITMKYFSLKGLSETDDYQTFDSYLHRQIDAPPVANPNVSDQLVTQDIFVDLSTPDALGVFNRYNGMWEVIDGELKVTAGQGNWNAGATFAAGKFKDFELKYSMKVIDGAWAGPILRKNSFNDSHEASGLLLYKNILNSGIVFYSTIEAKPFETILIDEDGFAHVTVRVIGNQLELKVGDGVNFNVSTYDLTTAGRTIAAQGYLSLNSGNATTVFKDISVRILKPNGQYLND